MWKSQRPLQASCPNDLPFLQWENFPLQPICTSTKLPELPTPVLTGILLGHRWVHGVCKVGVHAWGCAGTGHREWTHTAPGRQRFTLNSCQNQTQFLLTRGLPHRASLCGRSICIFNAVRRIKKVQSAGRWNVHFLNTHPNHRNIVSSFDLLSSRQTEKAPEERYRNCWSSVRSFMSWETEEVHSLQFFKQRSRCDVIKST